MAKRKHNGVYNRRAGETIQVGGYTVKVLGIKGPRVSLLVTTADGTEYEVEAPAQTALTSAPDNGTM